jgi:hypothetical protein
MTGGTPPWRTCSRLWMDPWQRVRRTGRSHRPGCDVPLQRSDNGKLCEGVTAGTEALPFIACTGHPPCSCAPTLGSLSTDGSRATETLSSTAAIRTQIAEGLDAGAGLLLELTGPDPQDRFSLSPEDGSITALLRAVHPAVKLDAVGALPLAAHGSTASGVLTAAECAVSARAPEFVVVVDDSEPAPCPRLAASAIPRGLASHPRQHPCPSPTSGTRANRPTPPWSASPVTLAATSAAEDSSPPNAPTPSDLFGE